MTSTEAGAIGMAVTTFFGTVWWIATAHFLRDSTRRIWGMSGTASIFCMAMILHWTEAPQPKIVEAGPPHPTDWLLFAIVVNTAWIIILILAAILKRVGRRDLIVTMIAFVIGVHCIPLGIALDDPICYIAAPGFILTSTLTFITRDAYERQAATCAMCASLLWGCTTIIDLTM